jgi:menaquinol-cytochrome c reductase iron-sulfur subunit
MTEARRGTPTTPPGHGEKDEGRRRTLKVLVGATSCAFASALAAPAVIFVTAPTRTGAAAKGRWVKTVRFDTLKDREPLKVPVVADQRDAWTLTKDVELGSVWLIRNGDEVRALSTTCPHLGCSIALAEDRSGFGCPCHTSAFDPEGRRTGGPAPRDMDPLSTRLEEGFVLVDFRRFRMSIADRIEVG